MSDVLHDYWTKRGLAEALNPEKPLSLRTLDRWETQRIGPPRTVIGRTVLYRKDSVAEWLQEREQRRGRRG